MTDQAKTNGAEPVVDVPKQEAATETQQPMPLVSPQLIDARVRLMVGNITVENEVLKATNEALVAKCNDLLNALAALQEKQGENKGANPPTA